jgi:hypothetical protein
LRSPEKNIGSGTHLVWVQWEIFIVQSTFFVKLLLLPATCRNDFQEYFYYWDNSLRGMTQRCMAQNTSWYECDIEYLSLNSVSRKR